MRPGFPKPPVTTGKRNTRGIEASDIKKIKDLEDENRRLKQMFADLNLKGRALKDVIEKSFKTSR